MSRLTDKTSGAGRLAPRRRRVEITARHRFAIGRDDGLGHVFQGETAFDELREFAGALIAPDSLFVGAKNASRSVQNQHVSVAHAIINQTVLSYGKGIDKRLATRAIHVAVQPDGEGP